jgi:hypothetical protein
MSTQRENIVVWLERGKVQGATHLIVVCDTFDHEDYPVFVSPDENVREIAKKYDGVNMQRIMEVYSINKDWETQLS